MRTLLAMVVSGSTLLHFQAFAEEYSLPAPIQESLKRAYDTKDPFIIEAVTQAAIAEKKLDKALIEKYLTSLKNPTPPPPPQQKDEKPKRWSGEIEAGMNITSGNSETFDVNTATSVNHETRHWGNTLSLEAYNSEEEGNRTAEEYRIEGQSRYKLANDDYIFTEGEYVNDRFSGFTYRISELLGYGRKLLDFPRFTLTGEAGIGARQTKFTDDTNENTLLEKIKAKAKWKVTDKITFTEELSSSFTSNASITESDTALKTEILDSLYLKLGINLEYISDVPAGKENLDSKTSFNIVYGF